MSVAYAGLGMKEHSDYNRNIYLDILEDTRQDKELESRYHALEKEEAQLNLLLFLVLAGLAGVLLFFWLFSRHSEVRNRLHLRRLQSVLDICRRITASIPADARSEKEMAESIFGAIYPELKQLFGTESIHIKEGRLTFGRHVRKREQAMAQVIDPYIQWTLDNGCISASLDMEQRRLEKQRYVHQQHIARNKRQNVVKKACFSIVNGIHPYIDRILNEAHKLIRMGYIHDETIKKEKYQYIDELVTTINEYNDILALWIKMKRGALSLEVENFELNELFALLRKGSHAFEMKRITLLVEATDVCIKADKALTLFMINTLAENARKYTPRGGKVKIYARAEEDYVEISVEDTGYGLSPEDVARIVGEKVYDSQTIGMSGASHPEELRKSKGSGFGLMNCKGIIEKYKKTNPLFNVCQFNVESVLGHGSRFSFRLPAGARKALALLLLAFSFGITSCAGEGAPTNRKSFPPVLRLRTCKRNTCRY